MSIRNFYQPSFKPWSGLGYGEFATYLKKIQSPRHIVHPDRCYLLYSLTLQALNLNGEFWECGVYRGGTALLFASLIADKANLTKRPTLRLFDTFKGMPKTDPKKDQHKAGDFADTSLDEVINHIGNQEIVSIHQGPIPDTFNGLEDKTIALAHIDVDIYKSTMDCCQFIYPRLLPSGFIICDDYGAPSCKGAKEAIDSYLNDKPEIPLILGTGQALIIKTHRYIPCCE